jgi:hypothetical protein
MNHKTKPSMGTGPSSDNALPKKRQKRSAEAPVSRASTPHVQGVGPLIEECVPVLLLTATEIEGKKSDWCNYLLKVHKMRTQLAIVERIRDQESGHPFRQLAPVNESVPQFILDAKEWSVPDTSDLTTERRDVRYATINSIFPTNMADVLANAPAYFSNPKRRETMIQLVRPIKSILRALDYVDEKFNEYHFWQRNMKKQNAEIPRPWIGPMDVLVRCHMLCTNTATPSERSFQFAYDHLRLIMTATSDHDAVMAMLWLLLHRPLYTFLHKAFVRRQHIEQEERKAKRLHFDSNPDPRPTRWYVYAPRYSVYERGIMAFHDPPVARIFDEGAFKVYTPSPYPEIDAILERFLSTIWDTMERKGTGVPRNAKDFVIEPWKHTLTTDELFCMLIRVHHFPEQNVGVFTVFFSLMDQSKRHGCLSFLVSDRDVDNPVINQMVNWQYGSQ